MSVRGGTAAGARDQVAVGAGADGGEECALGGPYRPLFRPLVAGGAVHVAWDLSVLMVPVVEVPAGSGARQAAAG
jgi:hypothetical protein